MASSLFAGDPLKAPSYAATTSDVPQWLQDYTVDLFSQQRAVAGTPYQPYALPRIAQTTAPTTQAQNLVQSSVGAYQPAVGGAIAGTQGLAGQNTGTTAGLGYLQQAAGMSGVGAAQPYLNTAGQTATTNIGQYMNPYTQNVTDQIASLGARNLSENLLPQVSDQFIRAGQFGSSGMGTFGGRALRDTQEAILNEQNKALQSGYTQALGASQTDLARQAQLATTAGQLTQAGQQNLGTIGAQTASTAQSEAARQQTAQQQVADLAKMQQGLTTADAAALESVGASQQQQQQRGLDVAYQDYQNQIQYPQTQINNMSTTLRGLPPTAVPTTGTTSGYTTTFAPSPLSGIAAAYGTYKGLTAANAKGGLIQGYASGGAVSGGDDLHASVMADYGKYLGNTNYYDSIMSQAQPAIDQNRNAMTNMAAYHASHAPIASPNTVPALYKQYNTLKNSLNPGAVDEASAAANAMQAKYNEGLNALNPGAVTSAADAYNASQAKYKTASDAYNTNATKYNAGGFDYAGGGKAGDKNRIAANDAKSAAGWTLLSRAEAQASHPTDPSNLWYRPPSASVVPAIPAEQQAEYDKLLSNYNTLNTGYNTGVTALAPQKAEYDALMAKYNTLNDAYTAGSAKLAPQKAAYEKAVKASEVPSPWGNAMPHLAHGGRVPGYADGDLVNTQNLTAPNYTAQPTQQVEPSGGGYDPNSIAAINPKFAAMMQQYGVGAVDYTKDVKDTRTALADERTAYNNALAKMAQTGVASGPSESEKWFRLAAAYADPGKTGSFLEGTGHAATAMAEHRAEQRKADAINAANAAQYGLKQHELTLESLRDEAKTIQALQAEQSKDRRTMITEYIKGEIANNKVPDKRILWQLYVEDEKAAGRIPLSYRDYDTEQWRATNALNKQIEARKAKTEEKKNEDPWAPVPIPTTVSMKDVNETAASSGKSIKDTIADFNAQGVTVK